MKGAVVSTGVLAIIAVVIIAGIMYTYYAEKSAVTPSTPNIPTGIPTQRECQSKLISYCDVWNANGYGRTSVSEGGRPGPWIIFVGNCVGLIDSPSADDCDRVLGKTRTTTGRSAT